MIRKKICQESITVLCTVVLILLAATTFSSGCIKALQKSPESAQSVDASSQITAGNAITSALPRAPPDPVQQIPIAEMTPLKSEVVTEVAPILPENPYPILHGVRVNATPEYSFLNRIPDFKKTYTLRGNATGLLVNVVEGPLYIVFKVKPEYDCLANPESCRGTLTVPVNRPFMTITVRDNQTHEIIAKDGYAREYSSDNGHYQIEVISKKGTTTSTPGPRYIPIYQEGAFHITVEGNYLDVEISIITGASPDPLKITTNAGTAASTPAPIEPQRIPPGWR
ncbi:MAG: hypothetical protein STSR0009_28370 [Methanoregula sp.]